MKKSNLIRKLPEGFEWRIQWKEDEYGDASWLGSFSSREPGDDFVVDRKHGYLLGPSESRYEQFVWAGDYPDEIELDGRIWELVDEETGEYEFHGRPILRNRLSTRFRYNEWEWWSTDNHSSVEEYGLEAIIKGIVADYERLCELADGSWYFEGCIVALMYVNEGSEELAEESLWGVESDRESSYTNEVEEDLMWEALDPKGLEELQFEAQATMLGAEQLGKPSAKAKKRYEAFTALLALYPEIQAERQAAWEAQQAAWKAEEAKHDE